MCLKKVIKVFLLLVLIFTNKSYSQTEKVVINNPYLILWKIDDHSFYEIENRKKRLYWDGKPIDSTGISCYFSNHILFINRKLLFFSDKPKNYFYAVNMNGKIDLIKTFSESILIENTLNNFFIKEKINFYHLNPITFKNSTIFNLENIKKISTDGFNLYKLINLYDDKILVIIRYCYDGCYNYHYFLVDVVTREIMEINLNKKDPNNESYVIDVLKSDTNYFLVEEFSDKISNQYFIYDKKFEEVSKALYHNINDIGKNYKDGMYISDNIRVSLDNDKIVIITYQFSLPIERSFYRIYKNEEILKEDIKLCGKYELGLLKNMIYAKYNYKFNDLFYQAYFNMFEFYNSEDKKTTRLTKVDYLFTEIDKKNLKTIEIALTKK